MLESPYTKIGVGLLKPSVYLVILGWVGQATLVEKNGKNGPRSFVHCSSFDNLDLHSLNNYKFVFFGLPSEVLGIWRGLMYCWKGLENTFPTVYYMPPKF